jgi:hypothetical protein
MVSEMITKRKLIHLIVKHTYKNKKKVNKIGLKILKQLCIKNTKIFLFSDLLQNKIHTRSGTKFLNSCIACCCDDGMKIAFDDKRTWEDDDLSETCVHEITHALNWNRDLTMEHDEFLSIANEILFSKNKTKLTFKEYEEIKSILNQSYGANISDDEFAEILKIKLHTI